MNIDEIHNKMNDSIKHFEKELQTIRTSRASPSMLENILLMHMEQKRLLIN